MILGEIIVNNVEKVRLEILRVTSLYPLATLLSEDCSTSYCGILHLYLFVMVWKTLRNLEGWKSLTSESKVGKTVS